MGKDLFGGCEIQCRVILCKRHYYCFFPDADYAVITLVISKCKENDTVEFVCVFFEVCNETGTNRTIFLDPAEFVVSRMSMVKNSP